MIKRGSLQSLDTLHDGLPAIIMGKELSRMLAVQPGDTVTVVSPMGKLTPVGRVPQNRKFKVTAIFESGMYEYDATMVYVSLKEAQDFLGLDNRATGVEVKVTDVYRARRMIEIGDLIGNRFVIRVSDIDGRVDVKGTCEAVKDRLDALGGSPNFFGTQRFGSVRPITHLIGKDLIRGDFEGAVMRYIANPMEQEDSEANEARNGCYRRPGTSNERFGSSRRNCRSSGP